MKRLALLAPLLFACIDFGSELSNRLAMLDGGDGTHDAGAPDSGTDSGSGDAGCPGPSPCFVTSATSGNGVMRIAALADGTFLGVVLTVVREESGSVLSSSGGLIGAAPDGGAYRAQALPRVPYGDGDAGMTDSITWPSSIAARGSSFAVTDYNGYATILDLHTRTVTASTGTCGYPSGFQSFNDVAWADDDTAWFASGDLAMLSGGHLCKWTRDGGFTPYDLGVEVDAGQYSFQSLAVVDGELFVGDYGGRIYTTYQASLAAPRVWRALSTDNIITTVSGTSVNQLWACGKLPGDVHGVLVKFNPGTADWTEVSTPPAMNVTTDFGYWQVLAVSPTDLWLVGEHGNVLHSTGDGMWEPVTLQGIDGTTNVWSVASHGPKDLALGVERALDDGGSQGELRVYVRP
jgi:hypothetical protein